MARSVSPPAVLAAAFACALAPAAQARTEAGFHAGYDKLDNNTSSWRNESAFVEHKTDGGSIASLRANATRRFGLEDRQLEGFYGAALSERLRFGVDANASPSHKVLPRAGLGGALQYELSRGWLVHGGARHTRYDAVTVNQLSAGIEHYFGNWGAALHLYNSNAFSENTQTLAARLSRYYGERDRINLILASGREPANIGGTVLVSDVHSVVLTGRHWLKPSLAIDYSVGSTRQGDFYTRTGASLGVVVAF